MEILIGIGVLLWIVAQFVIFWQFIDGRKKRKELEADNAALRNDLHAAVNARNAKSRGITGKYRKAIEAHRSSVQSITSDDGYTTYERALWSVLDSEAV